MGNVNVLLSQHQQEVLEMPRKIGYTKKKKNKNQTLDLVISRTPSHRLPRKKMEISVILSVLILSLMIVTKLALANTFILYARQKKSFVLLYSNSPNCPTLNTCLMHSVAHVHN